jgi:hypothetical protein
MGATWMRNRRPYPENMWMCSPCWMSGPDVPEAPQCPACGRVMQRPREVQDWTDEEWAERTGRPASERYAGDSGGESRFSTPHTGPTDGSLGAGSRVAPAS